MQQETDVLTVQKFIYLLDDFHYAEFMAHLSGIKAKLAQKLAATIRKSLPHFDTPDELCKKIYANSDKAQKQKFNQLCFYTFKLSNVLAQNYPDYLHPNISDIQKLVSAGIQSDAEFKAHILLDVADRVEDFDCQVKVLKFLSYKAFLAKDVTAGLNYNKQLALILEKQNLFTTIQSTLWNAIHQSKTLTGNKEFKKLKKYFLQYHTHVSPAIRIVSQYGYFRTIYYHNPMSFKEEEELLRIKNLEKELQSFDYLVMPFMSDFRGNFIFLKLNSPLMPVETKLFQKDFEELKRYYSSVKYLTKYLNLNQIHLMAIQITKLSSTYHHLLHRSDYARLITNNDLKLIKLLISNCDELMGKEIPEKSYTYEIMNLKMVRGALLILLGGSNIKYGVEELESLLASYQQVNLKASIDSIFSRLMVGYFSIKAYDKCAATFNRYLKVIKGKPVYSGNNVVIYIYYYISKWLTDGRPQFPLKLHALIKESFENKPPPNVVALIEYFKIPAA